MTPLDKRAPMCIIVFMAKGNKGNPNWGRNQPVDWCFCVRGEDPHGDLVTLGNYIQEKDATYRYNELVKEGYYRKIRVQHLDPKPTEASG